MEPFIDHGPDRAHLTRPGGHAGPPGPRRPSVRPGIAVDSLLLGAGLATLVLLPFLLAGRTGNPLWIAAPVFVTLLYVAARETPRCLAYYRSLWPWAWLPALAYALAAMAVTAGLATLIGLVPGSSPLDWSLGTAFGVGSDAGMNGFAIPLTNPLLALIYAPAAFLALPLLAWWEEDIFRRGTRGLRSALVRSTLFGLAHLTAGVSLGLCFALALAGMVFTASYWRALRDPRAEARRAALPEWVRTRLLPRDGGRRGAVDYAVFRASQAHLLYNAVVLAAIVVSLLL